MLRMALHWQILIAMLAGAAIGATLNAIAGWQQDAQVIEHPAETIQLLGMPQPISVAKGSCWSIDTPERILIQLEDQAQARTRRIVVGESQLVEQQLARIGEPWPDADGDVAREVVATVSKLKAKDPVAYALFHKYGRSLGRTVGDWSKLLGDLFLRMLKMVSIPLIITSLVSGVTGLGQAERLGKMFGRTLLYYLSTSMLAILIGLLMVNMIRPGMTGAEPLAMAAAADGHAGGKGLGVVLFEQLQKLIPPNPFDALATGNFLSIIAFSLAFAVCTVLVGGLAARRINELVDAAFQVMMKLTMLIIRIAPVGVFFLMLSATASQGAGVFGTLGWYMLTVACALAAHAMLVLPLILRFVAHRSPIQFAQAMSPALLTAFSSASSNGTL
ncbi:MAG: dicarboxylate/amino acid:cation symporter, partial [Bythopirellula sp.]